jgi:hypothetical protein
MLKWVFTVLIALVVIALATPWLARLGIGRLPGDFRIPLRGRVLYVPLASTLLLTALVWLIGRLV